MRSASPRAAARCVCHSLIRLLCFFLTPFTPPPSLFVILLTLNNQTIMRPRLARSVAGNTNLYRLLSAANAKAGGGEAGVNGSTLDLQVATLSLIRCLAKAHGGHSVRRLLGSSTGVFDATVKSLRSATTEGVLVAAFGALTAICLNAPDWVMTLFSVGVLDEFARRPNISTAVFFEADLIFDLGWCLLVFFFFFFFFFFFCEYVP